MPKLRLKNVQTAQGMVEFALVMPILLLMILGIFAFGHLFFSYSTVVAASREAARYGAAVGLGGNGQLRYQDCSGIRAAASRVGGFAGVGTTEAASNDYNADDPGVYIGYDHGPDPALGGPYDICPEGGTGPANVELGDRILVRVTIQYQPIVPLVNIPSFPLSATTARTIVKSLPVGEAPTAQPGCYFTSIDMEIVLKDDPPTLPWDPWVGQHVIPNIIVTASDGSTPTGTVEVTDDIGGAGHSCTFDSPSNIGLDPQPCDFVYDATQTGDHFFTVQFTPQNVGKCYQPSAILNERFTVVKANTVTEIVSIEPQPVMERQTFIVNVRVRADNPGGGVPADDIIVSDRSGRICTVRKQDLTTDATGVYSEGSCSYSYRTPDLYYLSAAFVGNSGYNPSTSSEVPLNVVGQPTPTLVPTPTSLPALPTDQCPYFNPNTISFPSGRDQLYVYLTNHNSYDFTVSRVSIRWPDTSPTALLKDVYFDGQTTGTDLCPNSNSPCIWAGKNQNAFLYPNPTGAVNLSSSTTGWRNVSLLKGETKQMVFTFSSGLLGGSYALQVEFNTSDGRSCTTPWLEANK